MFINAIKKAFTALKTEQHTSPIQPGICQFLANTARSTSKFVRKPLDWSREKSTVASFWSSQEEMTPLSQASQTADLATKTKWAKQLVEAAKELDCTDCENLLYEVKILVDSQQNIVLDISGCHHPVPFHESPDRRDNRMVFWLAIQPNIPKIGNWRTQFCLQQWLGESLYQIFEGTYQIYHGSILSWFHSCQTGTEVGFPTYNQPQNVTPEFAAVLGKMLNLKEGRYASFSQALAAAQNAL